MNEVVFALRRMQEQIFKLPNTKTKFKLLDTIEEMYGDIKSERVRHHSNKPLIS